MGSRVLINGMGRSGTTWVQKVFDQHPDVLAIFEPDLVLGRQPVSTREEIREVIEKFFACRHLRAMRRRPIMRKPYRSHAAHQARKGLIYGLSGMVFVFPSFMNLISGLRIPDLGDTSRVTMVAKTVSRERLIGEFAQADPDMKVIYVIRHPCGYVASQRAGVRSGKMRRVYLPDRRLLARVAEFSKPVEDVVEEDFSDLEIMAYRWAAFNDVAMEVAETVSNLRIVCYEDLCRKPIEEFQRTLEWSGLDWHPDCEDFLARSLASERDADDYHDVVRNPMIAAERWKTVLSAEEQTKILGIAGRSRAMDLFV